MARYIGSKCKMSRRVKSDLALKARGGRDIASKCKLTVKPGQHGFKKRKSSNYSLQLTAKQKIKYIYGILEKQFRLYYIKAYKSNSATGHALLELLERRLDNVVYRMGFASTRAEARQLVSHKLVLIDSSIGDARSRKVVSIPSYLVKKGDMIEIRDKGKKQNRIKDALKVATDIGIVDWVKVNVNDVTGTLNRYPVRDELPLEMNEQLVVELYSK